MFLTTCTYINVTGINWENARLNALKIDIAALYAQAARVCNCVWWLYMTLNYHINSCIFIRW